MASRIEPFVRKQCAILVCLLGLGITGPAAWGDACKKDGEVCSTSKSCCGSRGNNGVCVIAPGAKKGLCCTPRLEVCDGKDNDCNGIIDDGTARTSCDDFNACTADSCSSGQCVHTAISCDDANLCTTESCDPVRGCIYADVNCDDGIACTVDGCDAATGCMHAPDDGACDDHDACTTDTCDAVAGCSNVVAVHCDDGNQCTDDSCDPATGECIHANKPDGEACDDGSGCTEDEFCLDGVCGNGFPSCNGSGNKCLLSTCDLDTEECVPYPIQCPPVQQPLCFIRECNQSTGVCETTVRGSAGPLCQDQCSTDADCADNNACTVDSCIQGPIFRVCQYVPANCNDNDVCTVDVCSDPAVGCQHILKNPMLCDDGVACTIDSCDPVLGCVHEPDDSRCDDGLDCSIDLCDVNSGCVHGPDPSLCGNGICDLSCLENASNCPADCIGQNSCQGQDACTGATGKIGNSSCNGSSACINNVGVIGDGSCNNESPQPACGGNQGNIGNGSCNGEIACNANTGNIGNSSCNSDFACFQNQGDVGNGSCNANRACCGNEVDRGDNECNADCQCHGQCEGCP